MAIYLPFGFQTQTRALPKSSLSLSAALDVQYLINDPQASLGTFSGNELKQNFMNGRATE